MLPGWYATMLLQHIAGLSKNDVSRSAWGSLAPYTLILKTLPVWICRWFNQCVVAVDSVDTESFQGRISEVLHSILYSRLQNAKLYEVLQFVERLIIDDLARHSHNMEKVTQDYQLYILRVIRYDFTWLIALLPLVEIAEIVLIFGIYGYPKDTMCEGHLRALFKTNTRNIQYLHGY